MRSVAVTGASGYIGRHLLARLEADPEVDRIVAIDLAPAPATPKVAFERHDVRQPMAELFRRHSVTSAVHLAFQLNPTHDRARERAINLDGTERFLEACSEAGVGAALLASSGTVYGAWPDNPSRLPESAPLRGKPGFPYVQDKVALERLAERFANDRPATRVVLVRPSVVTGARMDNFIARFFEFPFFGVRGANPEIPLIHERDVASAIHALMASGARGPYNLNAPRPVPLELVARRVGARLLRLPAAVLYPLAAAAWRLRLPKLGEAPPAAIDYMRYPWVGDGRRVTRETGFRYRYSAAEALDDFAAQSAGAGAGVAES